MFIFDRKFFLLSMWVFSAFVVFREVDTEKTARNLGVSESLIQETKQYFHYHHMVAEQQIAYLKLRANNL